MANSSSEQPFTLFGSLTAARNTSQEYPVAELIKKLIETTGYEVCSPSYPRFTLSSYQFISQARDIRDRINQLCNKVETSNVNEDSWTSFEEYSDLIDPTEDVLFRFLLAAEKESNVDSTSFSTMKEYRTWSDEWEGNRMIIDHALQDLFKLRPTSTTEAHIKSLKRQDDKAYTQYLIRRMDKALRELREKNFTPQDAISKHAPEILTTWSDVDRLIWEKPDVEDTNVIWNTKTIKLLIGAFEVAARDKYSKMSQELKKPDVVKKLVDLGKSIKDLVEKKKTPEEVQKGFDGFVVDDNHSTPRKVNYGDLVPLAHDIRRPFFGQAAMLLKFFKLLVDRADQSNVELVNHLSDVMEVLRKALEDSKQAVTTLATDISQERKQQVDNQFMEAEIQLKGFSSKRLRLPDTERIAWEDKIKKARETDANHMKRLRNLNTTKTAPAPDAPEKMVTINITVKQPGKPGSQRPKREFTCTINGGMRMTTFLWHISANHLTDKGEVMINPVFKSAKGQTIDMDQEVKNVDKDLILELS
ncbi:hypothetical protein D9758_004987 [Tetrapyrgos nigripes]|uniref:Uncharacterized protein n=1 Tax=Tetrapyrgos nigripes TaxID=182062 RepID=A0A8H5LWL9_9AGAR|nr:hypothetical protein D9758_004987 [Tetrapyrgos nigripes]